MKLAEAFRKLHETDHFAAEVEKAMMSRHEFGSARPSRKPGRRGPDKQFTESVDASVTAEVESRLRKAANRRNISRAALVRQIFDAWLKANEEAWQ